MLINLILCIRFRDLAHKLEHNSINLHITFTHVQTHKTKAEQHKTHKKHIHCVHKYRFEMRNESRPQLQHDKLETSRNRSAFSIDTSISDAVFTLNSNLKLIEKNI